MERALHVNFKTKFDFRCGKATTNAPIFGSNFAQKNFDVVGRNAE